MATSILMLRQLAKVKGAQFARFTYTAKGTGETASVLVSLGVDFNNLYLRDIVTLEELVPTLEGIDKTAGEEVLSSLRESVERGLGNNSAYTHGPNDTAGSTYATVPGIQGVRIHKETGDVHLTCLFVSKQVLTPGTYKTVKSADKTIAKNRIRKNLRTSNIRSYKLSGLSRAALQGEVLEFS